MPDTTKIAVSDDSPELYILDGRDRALLAAASALLGKIAGATLQMAEMVSVAKLLHIISRLPRVSSSVEVSVSVTTPKRHFGEIETFYWWEIAVEENRLSISGGGHFFRPSTGGDTFTTMTWAAVPDEVSDYLDYRDNLAIVPDVQSFPDAVESMDFGSRGYKVEITDPDNPLLEDLEVSDDSDDEDSALDEEDEESEELEETDTDESATWSITPRDEAEKRLAAIVDADEVERHTPQYAYNAERCDFCGCALSDRALFVDGRLEGDAMWANMCAQCFAAKGEGIRWGDGQLYARQPNGDWRMVAGFPPSES